MQLLDCVGSMFSFVRSHQMTVFPPVKNKTLCCSTSSPALVVFTTHSSNRCVVVSCCFSLYSPNDIGCGASLICLLAIGISSLIRCLLSLLLIFVFFIFLSSFKSTLYWESSSWWGIGSKSNVFFLNPLMNYVIRLLQPVKLIFQSWTRLAYLRKIHLIMVYDYFYTLLYFIC